MGESSLDDILSDEDIVQEEIDEQPEQAEQFEAAPAEEPPAVEGVAEDPRDKELAGLKAALSETRGELRAYKTAQPRTAEPAPAPDAYDDLNGALKHQQESTQKALQNARLDMSEDMARTSHGDAIVDAAFAAFQEKLDPTLHASIMASRSPWNEVVKWHKRQTVMSEIGDDPSAWKEQQRAAIRAELQEESQKVAEHVTQVGNAPSLASEPNLGGRSGPGWSGPMSLNDILG